MAEPFDEKLIYKRILNRVVDAIALSIIFSVCCLPVITIGPALTALYYAAIKDMTDKDRHVVRNFFKSFKSNFKQSTLIFLMFLVVYFISGFDFIYGMYVWHNAQSKMGAIMIFVNILVLLLVTMIFIFVFPLQAKFDNPIRVQLKNAFSLALKNIPAGLLIIIVLLLSSSVIYAVPLTIIFFVAAGFGAMGYWFGSSLYRCMKKYIEINDEDEETDTDENEEHTVEESEADNEEIEE
ncbi:MAG: YesL family protein [Lachnospiraceae bacterium]|nr:YesL family protein [Lachnospiraceae bacterium]